MNDLIIEQVYYNNPKHSRVLEAVLAKWFKNPKDLHFTDPRLSYPFSFSKWIKLSYELPYIDTYVLKKEDWIIGHVSVLSIHNRRQKHIFHFFIDKESRGKGIGKWFLDQILKKIENDESDRITLRVSPKNKVAIKLYESKEFIVTGTTHSGSLTMEKECS